MRPGIVAGFLGVVCAGSVTRLVAAESVERLALSLDGTVVASESTTMTLNDNLSTVSESLENTRTSWGLLGGGFGVGVAYGVSNNFVIAGQALLSTSTFESKRVLSGGGVSQTDSATSDVSTVSLYPRLEYVFGDTAAFRPFIAGIVGLSSSKATSGDTEFDESRHSFGAGLGAHAFASPHFSIDPMLSVHRQGGSQTSTVTDSTSAPTTMDLTGTLVALTVSFTGWFGGSPSPASAAAIDDGLPPAAVLSPPPASSPQADDNNLGDTVEFAPIKTTQVVPGDHAIMLKGRPEALPKTVMIRLAESPTTDALRECREVRLVVGNRSYRVEHLAFRGRRQVGRQSRWVSDGLLPAQAINNAVDSEGAHLDVCGSTWPLTPAVRGAFQTFLAEFVRRRGTPFEPSAEPNAPTQPTEAPAPSDEGAAPAPTPSQGPPVAAPAPAVPAPATTSSKPLPAKPTTPAPRPR